MFSDYKEFCDSTPARNISFRSFLTVLEDNRDRQQLIGFWTGTILPYLQNHPTSDKRQRAVFLKKTAKSDLEAIIDEVFKTVSQPVESS